jgi:hypothetical protein
VSARGRPRRASGTHVARRLDAREIPSERAARSSSPPARRSGAPTRRAVAALRPAEHGAAGNRQRTPGSSLRLVTTPGGAQENRFVGCSQLISERVADRLGEACRAPRARCASWPRTASGCGSWPTARRRSAAT